MFNTGSDPGDLDIPNMPVNINGIPRIAGANIPAWDASLAGSVVFDTTAGKLKVAGASAWETVTSA